MNDNIRGKIQEHLRNNQHAEAIPLLESVCLSSQNNAEAYYLLGCSYARLGQHEKADNTLQKCIEIAPNVAQSHFALAGVRIAQGLYSEAVQPLQTTLKINNSIAEAHVALADIEIMQRNFTSARSHLSSAIQLKPDLSEAHLGLARLEQETENHEAAIKHIKAALRYKPNYAQALCAMANSIVGLARMANKTRLEDSIPYYKKSLRLDPGYIDAQAGLATLYEFTGEYDKAYTLIKPVIEKKTYHAIIGLAYVRLCKHFDQCTEAIDYINKVLEKPDIPATSKKTLHFAAAKVLDSMDRFDAAFSHYKAANEALGPQAYDTVGHAYNMEKTIKVFGPGLFMKIPAASHVDRRPVFIVGMPRSGTSLTEQILAAHSQVYGAGELVTLGDQITALPRAMNSTQRFPAIIETLTQQQIDRLSSEYLAKLDSIVAEAGAENAKRITDKMPHNFYFLGVIQLLFPGARIIHCQRDPIDTCLSIYFQDFNEKHDYARDLFKIGTHYNQYLSLMTHWQHILNLPIFTVRYEELIENQEKITNDLLEFCGLDWEDSCLDFYKLKRTINTPSYDQVRQPLYKKSVGRWRNYEKYLEPLMEGLQRNY